MSDDVFARIIKATQAKERELDNIGTITSLKPFRLKVGDLEVDKDNILINSLLLEKTIDVNFTTDLREGHRHIIKDKITIKSELKKGDEVLIQRNNQDFIIIAKVVKP